MTKALEASLSANKMTFDSNQIKDLVDGLWTEAGLIADQDTLSLSDWSTLLHSHQGLVESLVCLLSQLSARVPVTQFSYLGQEHY